MSINIVSSIDNKLLNRREIQAEILFEGSTPKRTEVKSLLCGKIDVNPDLTVIRSIRNNFGKRMINISVHAYSRKEDLMSTEPSYIKVREKFMEKKAKKKAAASAAKKG